MKDKPFKIPEWNMEWQYTCDDNRPMNIEAMSKNLLDMKEVFDKYEIPFVLIYGALLGIIREKNFIANDDDVDIACFGDTPERHHWKMRWVKNELKEKGFFIVDNSCCRCKTDFFIRNGERIDVFWFLKIDNEWIFNDRIRFPAYYFDKLDEIDFLGTKFKIPSNVEDFLELSYGKKWRIPNSKAPFMNLNPKEVRKRQKKSFNKQIVPWERGVRQGGNMNMKVMSENLLDFKEVLDKYKVTFVTIFGALLGIIREGNFISCDTDVDVACFNELGCHDHWQLKKVKEELIKKGFDVVSSDVCYLHNDFFIRNGEKIEIWWFDRIDEEWIFGDTIRYPAHYFDNLDEINFLGTKFKIPNNVEKFLELTYGRNWRKPNPKASYLNLNPKAIQERTKK